jgi:hypothetical protein
MPAAAERPLDVEISTYEQKKDELETVHKGKFVVVHGSDVIGVWDTFDAAALEAVRRFGRGPYLIRQVGSPFPTLPASVMFKQVTAA